MRTQPGVVVGEEPIDRPAAVGAEIIGVAMIAPGPVVGRGPHLRQNGLERVLEARTDLLAGIDVDGVDGDDSMTGGRRLGIEACGPAATVEYAARQILVS